MAEELLDRILRELRERMRVSRAAVEESRRLESALAALGDGAAPQRSGRHARRSPPQRSGSRDSRRARRGDNLRRIRDAVEQRPGASAGEVAVATGIGRATVASTLGKLARAGEFEKTELPGGRVGYRQRRDRSTEPTASVPATEDSQPDATEAAATSRASAAADG